MMVMEWSWNRGNNSGIIPNTASGNGEALESVLFEYRLIKWELKLFASLIQGLGQRLRLRCRKDRTCAVPAPVIVVRGMRRPRFPHAAELGTGSGCRWSLVPPSAPAGAAPRGYTNLPRTEDYPVMLTAYIASQELATLSSPASARRA